MKRNTPTNPLAPKAAQWPHIRAWRTWNGAAEYSLIHAGAFHYSWVPARELDNPPGRALVRDFHEEYGITLPDTVFSSPFE